MSKLNKNDIVIIDNPNSYNYGAIGKVIYYYAKCNMWLVSFPKKLKTVCIDVDVEASHNVFLLSDTSLKKLGSVK